MFDTLIVFRKEFFEKVDFEKSQQTTKHHENYPACRINGTYRPTMLSAAGSFEGNSSSSESTSESTSELSKAFSKFFISRALRDFF